MKVLFLKDRPPTAIAGEVMEVRKGFARNYLVPRGMAVAATDEMIERSSALIAEAAKRREMLKQEWADIAAGLPEKEVVLEGLSTSTGKLYGSITRAMVAQSLSNLLERDINAKSVRLSTPIRVIGKYKVQIEVYNGVVGTVNVVVNSSGISDIEPALPEGEEGAEGEGSGEGEAQGPDTANATETKPKADAPAAAEATADQQSPASPPPNNASDSPAE